MYAYNIGVIYTFNTKAPGILQATVKNAKLMAILDYETAKMYDNIDLKYRQIYPILPPGTPNTPESCKYLRFLTESGEKIILADQWIDESTIDTVEKIVFQVTVFDAALEDMNRVRDSMNAMGYMNYEIKQISPVT